VRQLLTEGLLLSAAGGLLGVVLAAWGLDVIRSVTFEPFFQLVVVDRRVAAFCALLALVAPLLFALFPALQATRLDLVTFLKEAAGGAVSGSRGRTRLRGSLVAGQLALAITLLVVAGLSVRTAVALRRNTPGAELVAVANQAVASRYVAGRDPLGKRIRLGDADSPWLTIVGVSANVVNEQLASIVDAARRVVARLDAEQPLYDVKTMERGFFEELAGDRVVTGLFAVFALVALTLATVGLYGLVSFAVSQRSREIGLRMALGARRGDVLRLVMAQGGRLVLVGLATGLGLGFAMARVMASGLLGVGISPQDPLTFVVVPGVLVVVSLLATLVPARRASRLDPASVLRSE
jgi:ABC-type antimicrobial peptide transport system permease subunit